MRRRAPASIPQPIVAKKFMTDMGINGW